MGASVRLLTVRGITIEVHLSWLLVYGLITWTLAVGYFPRILPDAAAPVYWVSGLIAALLLFVSVLLHELSHAFVALGQGLPVRRITLFMFGGVSHLEDEPRTARSEFLIAAAGPVTSFAIAAILWAVRRFALAEATIAATIVGYLVSVNVAVGVFNLVPGFPLDGGRLLRAALWRWHGSVGRATYLASRVGVGFAVLLIVLGAFQTLRGSFVGGVWLVLIGLFLRTSADASYTRVMLREALRRFRVQDVMTRDVVAVQAGATLADLAELFWAHHVTSFPVVDGSALRGLVTLKDMRRVPREAWARTPVRDVMRPRDDAITARPTDPVLTALARASRNGVGRLAVVDGERVVGYLSLKDIMHVLLLSGVSDRLDVPAIVEPLLRRAA